MSESNGFEHIRHIDLTAVRALPFSERVEQALLSRDSGSERLDVVLVRSPATNAGDLYPAHTHNHFDQVFFVIEGDLRVEMNGGTTTASDGDLVVIPSGVEHRVWTVREEPTIYLGINGPAYDAAIEAPAHGGSPTES